MDKSTSKIKERNPITYANHRREVFWQITLPLLLIILLFLVVAALSITSSSLVTSSWADVSLIWLILLASIPTLVIIAIIGGLAYLIIRLIQVLPPFALKAQSIFALVQAKVHQGSDAVVEPIIKVNSFFTSLRKLRKE